MATAKKYRDYDKPEDIKKFIVEDVKFFFVRVDTAQQRVGRDGKPRGKPQYNLTFGLDPSNVKHAAMIKEIKTEAARLLNKRFGEGKWGKGVEGYHQCFGTEKDLKKVYEGYEGLFWIKAADTNAPIIFGMDGRDNVSPEDEDFPYSGATGRGRLSLYTYDNDSIGINANLLSLRVTKLTPRIGGGGGRRSVEEEVAAMRAEEDAMMDQATATQPARDPFED